jgi:hypothetical protein
MELCESRWIETEWSVPLKYVGSEAEAAAGIERNPGIPFKRESRVSCGGGFKRRLPPDWRVGSVGFERGESSHQR